jgi:DNA polymerase
MGNTLCKPHLTALQAAWLQEIGIDRRSLAPLGVVSAAEDVPRPVGAAVAPTLVPVAKVLQAVEPGRTVASDAIPQDWAGLRSHAAACRTCALSEGRSQIVFGAFADDPASQAAPDRRVAWMVIGEAPGEHDDKLGLPFQGKMGALLHAMLAAANAESAGSVFLTNLVKCRPLTNRPPRPGEIAACMPYLKRQIALLNPQLILALGQLATQTLLEDPSEFERLRGRVHSIRSENGNEIPLVATYSPAYLLSRPQYKPAAWHDLKLGRDLLAG